MDILRAEIARKRKLLEEKKLVDDKKKYFKRGDLIAEEQREYFEKYGHKNPDLVASQTSIDKDTASNAYADAEGFTKLPRSEVVRKLRERCEPILLFGESEQDAYHRLRQLEILAPESSRGFRNDFQQAMDEVDQMYLKEILDSAVDNGQINAPKEKKSDVLFDIDENVTYEQIQEMAIRLGRGDKDHDIEVIKTLLKFLLNKWSDQLKQTSTASKASTKGKIARATFTQTKVYLKPLLRKLSNRTLPEDILDSLMEITKCLLHRDYLKASDAYLTMAIGNAPWPIGVTMVGIHARTGREKIFSKNVAHVMNDETQRKYIQGLKRLMTKCQDFFPTDPSRCVEYVPEQKTAIATDSGGEESNSSV